MKSRSLVAGGAVLLSAACLAFATRPQLVPNLVRYEQASGTHETLIAISAVSHDVAWASGLRGTVVRTTNSGETWESVPVAGKDDLDFRNIYGVNDKTAYVLSVGPGRLSRIFKTDDGGKHWLPKFMNIDPSIHWKCLSFWDPDHGVAISDAVKNDFVTMSTTDGGWHWERISSWAIPAALDDEKTSAASGTCLFAGRGGRAWFATSKSRVLRTDDFGETWKMAFVHISKTDSTGIGSVTFRDRDNGIAFGEHASSAKDTILALTTDGGETWQPLLVQPLMTQISAGAYVPELTGPTLFVVGPQGATFSRDGGQKWERVDSLSYNSISFVGRSAGWAVGKNGIITKFSF